MALSNAVQYNLPAIGIVEEELAGFAAARLPAQPAQPAARVGFRKALSLRDVSFRYPTRTRDALSHIDLTILPGERIGIIGPTGSGKSTLLDVLLGLLEPDAGEVLLDDEPLQNHREGWHRSIGYVPQDVYLVDDTLRANIALGWRGDDIDDEAVLEAVRLAELEEVVASLPEGVETTLGERGIRISGGQRQRVGLARALYTRPNVLVLDEATSNLDQVTEARVADTLTRLPGGVTMVIVSHRISTVRNCDRIICVEGGTIKAVGTFADVALLAPELLGSIGDQTRDEPDSPILATLAERAEPA
ncbi:MAG TPA: ATP-binding cassette domain-containing protein [Gaiellaceae bacterium]|nr:ATP-binding cassette domain-containing protein [Gaiellaceae bacterium]